MSRALRLWPLHQAVINMYESVAGCNHQPADMRAHPRVTLGYKLLQIADSTSLRTLRL